MLHSFSNFSNTAAARYLEIKFKMSAKIFDPDLAFQLHLLSHRRNVDFLHVFYKYFHGHGSEEICSTVPRVYKFKHSSSFSGIGKM